MVSGGKRSRWYGILQRFNHSRTALAISKSGYTLLSEVVKSSRTSTVGQVRLADATKSPLPDATATVWFTDPPYWDNVAYADFVGFLFCLVEASSAGPSATA